HVILFNSPPPFWGYLYSLKQQQISIQRDQIRATEDLQKMGSSEAAEKYPWRLTFYVMVCWVLAACGGLMFGYDIGISGGVTGMDDFLNKFFPSVYVKKRAAHENNYCKFDNQFLQLFTSSLYLSALFSSFVASKYCSTFGRKSTIIAASLFFLSGTLLSALSSHLWMVIVGRVIMGVGVGFGNESVPLFLSEIAPIEYRGAINILFQLLVTIGILVANVVNYFTSSIHPNGWRWSLGGGAIPSLLLLLGGLVITDSPASLMERGRHSAAHKSLQRIRGLDDVDAELAQIQLGCSGGEGLERNKPFRELVATKQSVPPLVIGIAIQVFQQMTGINAVMFYAPILFQTVGFKNHKSLMSAVIIDLVNVVSTLVSVFCVDRVGRRALLLQACVQMFISQMIIGILLITQLHDTNTLSKGPAVIVVILTCTFVMSFAWSWGPLGWLIPSETFPVETRTAGYAFAVSSNMLFTFLLAQTFLSMLCRMRAFVFIFFSGWIVVMGVFVVYLLPETKGIPIDQVVDRVWRPHPVWRRFVAVNQGHSNSKP
ncbi:hypothetical protein V2J09_014183, partial [Rumex salicifolius]